MNSQHTVSATLENELIFVPGTMERQSKSGTGNTKLVPVPATFLISSDAIIRYAFVDTDYRKRAGPADIFCGS